MAEKINYMDAIVAPSRKFDPKDPATIKAARENLIAQIQDIESQAMHLGMVITSHAINRAKNAAGWELAGNLDQAVIAAARQTRW